MRPPHRKPVILRREARRHPERITSKARDRYVAAYSTPTALKAGFDWYRGFTEDAAQNAAACSPIRVPLLYLRGDREPGDIGSYAEGLRAAGVEALSTGLIEDSGHFTPEEQPEAVWDHIARFLPSSR